jgi:hypothetical protein
MAITIYMFKSMNILKVLGIKNTLSLHYDGLRVSDNQPNSNLPGLSFTRQVALSHRLHQLQLPIL